jgi:hypothetical protein
MKVANRMLCDIAGHRSAAPDFIEAPVSGADSAICFKTPRYFDKRSQPA